MKHFLELDKPKDWDKFKGTVKSGWSARFARAHGFSMQKKTNVRLKSVKERLHKVRSYDYYMLYEAPFKEP